MKRVNMQIVSWVVCVTQKLNHRIFFYSILLEKLSPSLSSIQLYKHSSSLLWLLRCLFPPDFFFLLKMILRLPPLFLDLIFAAKNLHSHSAPSCPSLSLHLSRQLFSVSCLYICLFASINCFNLFPRSLLSNALTPCLFLLYLTFFLKRCQNI